MFLIDCPNCGKRNVNEFHCGGEVNPRPQAGEQLSDIEWVEYLYMHDNPLGMIQEWWYHRAGCGEWFLVKRHTRTHEVLNTYFYENRERP
ncbi:MAG: sarcosine oxidase subunit delta [Candidatus Bipolaricaulia bacterium]